MVITLPSSSFFTLAAATNAKYWMTFLVFSVLPAPDSPVINIDWFSRSKQGIQLDCEHEPWLVVITGSGLLSIRIQFLVDFWWEPCGYSVLKNSICRHSRSCEALVRILHVRSLHGMSPCESFPEESSSFRSTALDRAWLTAVSAWLVCRVFLLPVVISRSTIRSSLLIISFGISVAQGWKT